jgi:hypothetical protein
MLLNQKNNSKIDFHSMKTLLKYVLIISIVSALFSSCKKYPDGPVFSFLSRTSRLSNTWHLDSYSENGVDKTDYFNNVFQNAVLVIDKHGSYSYTYLALGLLQYGEDGNWNFINHESNFETHPTSGGGTYGLHHILKLEKKELWYYDDDNGTRKEYHLIPV